MVWKTYCPRVAGLFAITPREDVKHWERLLATGEELLPLEPGQDKYVAVSVWLRTLRQLGLLTLREEDTIRQLMATYDLA